jgi:hypothetical protein
MMGHRAAALGGYAHVQDGPMGDGDICVCISGTGHWAAAVSGCAHLQDGPLGDGDRHVCPPDDGPSGGGSGRACALTRWTTGRR